MTACDNETSNIGLAKIEDCLPKSSHLQLTEHSVQNQNCEKQELYEYNFADNNNNNNNSEAYANAYYYSASPSYQLTSIYSSIKPTKLPLATSSDNNLHVDDAHQSAFNKVETKSAIKGFKRKFKDLFEPPTNLNQPNVTTIMQKPVDMGETKRYKRKNSDDLEKRRTFVCKYHGEILLN